MKLICRFGYKGHLLHKTYRVDFVCYDSLLVEIKALSQMGNIETSKVINYLKATNFDRALLVNFGTTSLQYKRNVNKWKPLKNPRNLRNH